MTIVGSGIRTRDLYVIMPRGRAPGIWRSGWYIGCSAGPIGHRDLRAIDGLSPAIRMG